MIDAMFTAHTEQKYLHHAVLYSSLLYCKLWVQNLISVPFILVHVHAKVASVNCEIETE